MEQQIENKKTIEVCFTPILYPYKLIKKDFVVIIVDVLRATTTICTAFQNGAKAIVPIANVEDINKYKNNGFIIAGERDGIKLENADLGNSPFNFTKEVVADKTIVITTTNGTQAIEMAKDADSIVIGSFLNLNAIGNWITEQNKNVIILCAGWKNKFNLEDTLFAGALVEYLSDSLNFNLNLSCDSAIAALDLWTIAKEDLLDYVEKTSHRHRLKRMVLDDVIEYCFTPNVSEVIPAYIDGKLIDISEK